jgi:hypothetical protein
MGHLLGSVEGQQSKGRDKRDSGGGKVTKRSDDSDDPRVDASERLSVELARLRAKFGTDPAAAGASLAEAWMSPTASMEEDEAEFIDAVADCLGAGLPLDAALACWDRGELFSADGADGADGADDEEESVEAVLAPSHHPHPPHARRFVVS